MAFELKVVENVQGKLAINYEELKKELGRFATATL